MQEVLGEGGEMVSGFDQPLQHRVGLDLKHAGDRADAQAFRQRTHRPYQQVGRDALTMKQRAMGFLKIPFAGRAVQLAPGTATGMTSGLEIAQSYPAAIATVHIGTEMA